MRVIRSSRSRLCRCHHLTAMKSSSKTTSTATPIRPICASTSTTLPTASRKTTPRAIATPAQSAAPIASRATKTANGRRWLPARLVAIVAKPGMNLATSSDAGPQRVNSDSVWRTHESGESEIRQTLRTTRPP